MKTCRFILAIMASALIFASCTTTQSVPIEVLKSGKVNLPAQKRNLAFLARNFKYNVDTLGNYFSYNYKLKKAPEKENKGLDSLAVQSALSSLQKKLLATGRYDTIVTYPFNAIRPHRGKHVLPLSPGFVTKVCQESHVDGLVALEMLSYFYSKTTPGVRDQSGESIVKINALWALYLPGKEKPVDHFRYTDQLVWDRFNQDGVLDLSKKIPGRTAAVEMAAQIAGEQYARHMGPFWATANRTIVAPSGDEWKKATQMAQHNQWEEAAAIWNKLASVPNERNRGIAELNLAVASEMMNQIDLAVSWASKAVKLLDGKRYGPVAGQYLAILMARQRQISRLNQQIK